MRRKVHEGDEHREKAQRMDNEDESDAKSVQQLERADSQYTNPSILGNSLAKTVFTSRTTNKAAHMSRVPSQRGAGAGAPFRIVTP